MKVKEIGEVEEIESESRKGNCVRVGRIGES